MIITIGGEYGSGGKRIARIAAEKLGYKLCSDEIVAQAVNNTGVNMTEETFKYFGESRGKASVKDIKKLSGVQSQQYLGLVDSLSMDVTPLERRMDEVLRRICNDFADQGNCILLGHCADYYLQGRDNCIHVFVIDELSRRVQRLVESHSISEAESLKLIRKTDQRRADYYAFFTGKKWGDMDNYDLICRCGLLGVEGCAELICSAVSIREGKK